MHVEGVGTHGAAAARLIAELINLHQSYVINGM